MNETNDRWPYFSNTEGLKMVEWDGPPIEGGRMDREPVKIIVKQEDGGVWEAWISDHLHISWRHNDRDLAIETLIDHVIRRLIKTVGDRWDDLIRQIRRPGGSPVLREVGSRHPRCRLLKRMIMGGIEIIEQ